MKETIRHPIHVSKLNQLHIPTPRNGELLRSSRAAATAERACRHGRVRRALAECATCRQPGQSPELIPHVGGTANHVPHAAGAAPEIGLSRATSAAHTCLLPVACSDTAVPPLGSIGERCGQATCFTKNKAQHISQRGITSLGDRKGEPLEAHVAWQT